ncbi:MAG: hypothetical protein D6781_12785 [Verrucomicrobia bacterium]|nr:MAG: hypothetical protein D6781_12785 [Verrucomicrobiota bacterium]
MLQLFSARRPASSRRVSGILLIGLTLLALLAVPRARAITVRPPTFDELVAEAGAIVRGRVIAVEPFRTLSADGTPIIKTRVTWQVERALKGAEDRQTLTLEFLGGTIGEDSLHVGGMPVFRPGETDYLFTEPNTRVICPLIAAGHGRYRVLTDPATGSEFIARDNRLPLTAVTEVNAPLHATASASKTAARGLSPETFESLIRQTLARITASRHAR